MGFAPGGGVVTLGAEDVRLVWPVGGGRPRKARPGEGPYDAVAPVGGLAATLGDTGVRLWRDGKAAGILATGSWLGAEASPDVALSPDGRSAATTDAHGIARVWDVASSASLALRHVAAD